MRPIADQVAAPCPPCSSITPPPPLLHAHTLRPCAGAHTSLTTGPNICCGLLALDRLGSSSGYSFSASCVQKVHMRGGGRGGGQSIAACSTLSYGHDIKQCFDGGVGGELLLVLVPITPGGWRLGCTKPLTAAAAPAPPSCTSKDSPGTLCPVSRTPAPRRGSSW
jgi:hypothetical protein